ncbi:MAG: transcriptional repressor NrdR [Myxococcales bacterium]|nr:transcriptional repressor NrdR [Myxococcales bacterium]
MRCPYCATLDNRVMDSRLSQGGEVTRRRRECEGCGRRYTTYERVESAPLPAVIKKDGSRQPYDRSKLMAGLRRACVKRPVTTEALDRLLDALERALIDRGDAEVTSAEVGEEVLASLRALDPVAYVRFASVYREFQDVREFVDELSDLQRGGA